MLDFIKVALKYNRNGNAEAYPKFVVPTFKKSEDLMIRGGDFYAVWDESQGLWSTSEELCLALIDRELKKFADENKNMTNLGVIDYMWDSENGMIDKWHKYVQKQLRDNYHALDESIIFANTDVQKTDYCSKKLPYALEKGTIDAWDELIGTLYSPEERRKLEWAIGAIVSGESKNIQKFIVMYGPPGSGKSTILNIIQMLFEGYYSVFDAKALGSANNQFALEAFKANPLVAIQHDGDLSRIEDNTRLNSVVSHELMTINEKFKATYVNRFNSFLFMGTNKPVKISDAKSGILRRLIDVTPTGITIPKRRYNTLMRHVKFELGAIAWHCLEVFRKNERYYDDYVPLSMMSASNDFYNFMEDMYMELYKSDGVTLKAAWERYKVYCDDAKVSFPYNRRVFKEELKSYFEDFFDTYETGAGVVRSYYKGFKRGKFENAPKVDKPVEQELEGSDFVWEEQESEFDKMAQNWPAQYAKEDDTPKSKWEFVTTKLRDIDVTKVHYVLVPENHIVIDFDIKDESGNKCLAKNIDAARLWPPTYAEVSKGGNGMHLHYIYDGDVSKLASLYADGIEVKVYSGKSSLRRKLTRCNNLPVAHISSGLPLKEERLNMVSEQSIKSERGLRNLIVRNLKKECCPGTKPSVDFIKKILDDAYSSGLSYDVTDMRNAILAFANSSTHHALYCLQQVGEMKLKSEDSSPYMEPDEDTFVFFDIEVYPNLFVVCWKFEGSDSIYRMINPKAEDIEMLLKYKLIGFNNRKYDNHIIYAAMMGYSIPQLYELSQRIINKSENCFFLEAYNLSYTDVYDFASSGNKQSLKKWEIELGIHHQEMGLPWDQPVEEQYWDLVADYCCNDVKATEAVFNHLKGDWEARQMLAAIANGNVNQTTNTLSNKFLFDGNKKPQGAFYYRDLSKPVKELDPAMRDFLMETFTEMFDATFGSAESLLPYFEGYTFIKDEKHPKGYSLYKGYEVGEGGFVWADPGLYWNVWTFDVASMHPHSMMAEYLFGIYTYKLRDIIRARIAIKHKDYELAKSYLDGALAPFLQDKNDAKSVANALKTVINSLYGLSDAGFENPCRDERNIDNIVAKRGALFMIDLKEALEVRGVKVIHIKTDSIKVVNPDQDTYDFIMHFGKRYGYTFEIEHKFEKICLVNNAVYIAKTSVDDDEMPGQWTATGTQFAVPYIFKTLFSHEEILFSDLCETKTSKAALYLDFNESLPEGEHSYQFVGKCGLFTPVKPGCGGAELFAKRDEKYYAVGGTKGYRWVESETLDMSGNKDKIDMSYYDRLVEAAVTDLHGFCGEQLGAFLEVEETPPWKEG